MFEVEAILRSGGLLILAAIIFAECGLLIGFFLPGDTLLIAAGLLASTNPESFPIALVLPTAFAAAVLGYYVGYLIGERAGPKVFNRKGGILFREDYAQKARKFSHNYGPVSVILARFVPIVRTIIPLVAGVGKMPKGLFMFYNIVGAFLWTIGLTLAAYWAGNQIPDLDKIIFPLLVLAMLSTMAFVFWQFARSREKRRNLRAALKEEWSYLTGKQKN